MIFRKLDTKLDEALGKIKDKKIDCHKEILVTVHDIHLELVPEAIKLWTMTKLVALGAFAGIIIGIV